MAKPKLLTITGPSGGGKTELLGILCQNHNFAKLVSVTTRPMRPGEVEGVDYYFISEDRFRKLQELKALVQEVNFNGAWYGTTQAELVNIVEQGKIPAVIVEPGGVDQFAEICDSLGYELVSVYVGAQLGQLVERFIKRMVGETITEDRAAYYSRRLNSLFYEYETWEEEHSYHMYVYNTGTIDKLISYAQNIAEYTQ